MQGNSAAQHVQIQKIRASIARDIAMSKRSTAPASKKRTSQRPQHTLHAVLHVPSGLPEAVLGETKSFVRMPAQQQLRTQAPASGMESKRGSFRSSAHSTSNGTVVTETRECKSSVGRLKSGRKGSHSNASGSAPAPSRTASVARASSSTVLGTQEKMTGRSPEGAQGGCVNLARSNSVPTGNPSTAARQQQPDAASQSRAFSMVSQHAETDIAAPRVLHQSDTCLSEEQDSDGSGDAEVPLRLVGPGNCAEPQIDLNCSVPTIPTAGY